MAEPRSFLDVIRDLNIGPRGLSPSAFSRVGSAEEARQAQTALENRPAPAPVTLPTVPNIGIDRLQAGRMAQAQAADPAVQNMAASLKPVPQTVSDSVSRNLVKALNTGASNGTDMGNADRKAAAAQTMLGGDLQALIQNILAKQNPTPPKGDFVSNLLRMFAQPEFQQAGFAGQGFGPTVLGATKALRAMETQDAEMMKAQMEAQVKLAEAQESSFPKPSAEISKIYDTIDASQRRVNKVNEIKSILSDQISTGGFGTGLAGINKLASLFGFSISPSGQQNVNNAVAELKQLMVQARVFGRETSAKEQEIVDRLLPNASAFNNPETILKAIDRELKRAEQDAANAAMKLDLYGLPKRSDLVRNRQIGIESRQPGQ